MAGMMVFKMQADMKKMQEELKLVQQKHPQVAVLLLLL